MARPRTPAGRARLSIARLAAEYPGSAAQLCELKFSTPFELLVATVLSAQTTDTAVNAVTPAVFAHYPTPGDLGAALPDHLETLIFRTGFYRSKARSLIGLGAAVDRRFAGVVPTSVADLITLPGVGRKTANVVRSVGFDLPGLPVDTHVTRLSRLLGLSDQTDAERIESDLTAMVPRREWGSLSLRLILHGRRVCVARRARCELCVLADFCPSVQVGAREETTSSVERKGDKQDGPIRQSTDDVVSFRALGVVASPPTPTQRAPATTLASRRRAASSERSTS